MRMQSVKVYKFLLFLIVILINKSNAICANPIDTSTYANIDDFHTTHTVLNLQVDFDENTFNGTVVHTMKNAPIWD